jgi:hypothetical protein
MTPGLRRLYAPTPVAVETDREGTPLAVDKVAVEAIREQWVVDDRWWLPQKLRRHYFELALANGRATVVFYCTLSHRWYRQRA